MPSSIATITVDCRDPYLLARFWSEVLGYADHPENPNAPDDPEAYLIDPRGLHPALLFVPVPEAKAVKNRVHLDLRPSTLRDDEVERVLALGGTLVADHRKDDGTGWAVLADPEGNELCIERSAAERGIERTDTGFRRFPTPKTAGERELLEGMLEWYRTGVLAKVDGIAQHLAVATPLASSTSIAGLVKHLALVEDSWFAEDLAGEAPLPWWADVDWEADRDWEFHSALTEPFADQVARYREACERARQIAARYDLDHVGADTQHPPFTLRYVLVHMIEETARHLGHLDVLRELLDGTTGE
ncbi:MAG TPA: DUF664 domain-containing protein [Acidimicrobiales bacterium]|jgi:hypothetical protein|nr:DUF664 domain-containing protein [Acidimicrobiales bacterium]